MGPAIGFTMTTSLLQNAWYSLRPNTHKLSWEPGLDPSPEDARNLRYWTTLIQGGGRAVRALLDEPEFVHWVHHAVLRGKANEQWSLWGFLVMTDSTWANRAIDTLAGNDKTRPKPTSIGYRRSGTHAYSLEALVWQGQWMRLMTAGDWRQAQPWREGMEEIFGRPLDPHAQPAGAPGDTILHALAAQGLPYSWRHSRSPANSSMDLLTQHAYEKTAREFLAALPADHGTTLDAQDRLPGQVMLDTIVRYLQTTYSHVDLPKTFYASTSDALSLQPGSASSMGWEDLMSAGVATRDWLSPAMQAWRPLVGVLQHPRPRREDVPPRRPSETVRFDARSIGLNRHVVQETYLPHAKGLNPAVRAAFVELMRDHHMPQAKWEVFVAACQQEGIDPALMAGAETTGHRWTLYAFLLARGTLGDRKGARAIHDRGLEVAPYAWRDQDGVKRPLAHAAMLGLAQARGVGKSHSKGVAMTPQQGIAAYVQSLGGLAAKMDWAARADDGSTVLHVAAQCWSAKLAQQWVPWLIDQGVPMTATDAQGRTCLDIIQARANHPRQKNSQLLLDAWQGHTVRIEGAIIAEVLDEVLPEADPVVRRRIRL